MKVKGTTGWGQSYGYDGFGNLTAKTATKGTVPTLSVAYDGTTNHQMGVSYDANGNTGGQFDVENRMVVDWGGRGWAYDPSGKRVYQEKDTSGMEYYVYGMGGQKLVTVKCGYHTYQQGTPDEHTELECANSNHVYFAGKLVKSNGVAVATDRLGSVRGNANGEVLAYYPYGEERGTSVDGREKFGTYTRDSVTQDYADQRYYAVGMGRFNTADPYRASANGDDDAAEPSSWNRYAYTKGDPVNFVDPTGQITACPGGTHPAGSGYTIYCAPDSGYFVSLPTTDNLPTKHTVREWDDEHLDSVSTFEKYQKTIAAGLKLAAQWLQKDSCKGLYGTSETRANGFDPVTLMSRLYGNGDTYVQIGSTSVTTAFVEAGPLPLGMTIPLGPASVVDVAVFINMSRVGKDSWEAALTMMHEMGHVYNLVGGSGGSQITRGVMDDYAGWNDDRIIENCVK